jgi:hypothetical protein
VTRYDLEVRGLAEVQARFGRAHQLIPQTLGRVLYRDLNDAVTHAKTRYLSGGTTADRLAVRSGALRNSFGSRIEIGQSWEDVKAIIGYILPQATLGGGDALVYARVHEGWPDGRSSTTIKPSSAHYLTIPLDAAKTAAGVACGRARDFPNTFVQRSKRGQLFIFQRTATGIQPLFLLVPEVVVPARPALRPTMALFLPRIAEHLGQALTQLLTQA